MVGTGFGMEKLPRRGDHNTPQKQGSWEPTGILEEKQDYEAMTERP